MSVKAVVFDYGKVICFPPPPAVIDRLAEKAGVAREKFEPILWACRNDFDRGTADSKTYYKKVLSILGVELDEKTIAEMIAMDLAGWKNINTATVSLMEDVKKQGYTLGILSNMPHEFLAWARNNVPVFSLPHVSLFSCEVHLLKPEKAIYEKMIFMLGIEAEELVFFDDNAENIESAAAMGIKAFLWEDPEAARRQLLSLGMRI